ncbi:MAG: lipase family protein [Sphingomonadaceae bacterium]|nr:lipase family protein [Sphingomonadaceae bacterium]
MDYDPTKRALFHPEDRDPTPGFGLRWSRELICAELSRLAYYRFEDDNRARLTAALRGGGFSDPQPFVSAAEGAQGFGTIGDGVAYVAFRGTQPDSVRDLLADARFGPEPWPGGGNVHGGFLRVFDPLHRGIKDWLGRAGHRALVATGHSLGAAMATLMAAAHPEAQLISFGSPRVGDRTFAGLFAGRQIERFVDCADMVTQLPPDGLFGYVHLDGLRYIDRHGRLAAAPPSQGAIDADRTAARLAYVPLAVDVLDNVPTRDLADHAPINYVGALLGQRTGP